MRAYIRAGRFIVARCTVAPQSVVALHVNLVLQSPNPLKAVASCDSCDVYATLPQAITVKIESSWVMEISI